MTTMARMMTIVAMAGLASAVTLAMDTVRAQSAGTAGPMPSMGAPASATAKKAPDQFKNIQVLKDLNADQLQPAMQFVAASLGVECSYCHVENAPERDDKRQKVRAREMLQMTADINRTAFNGHRDVTCFSCHRGATSPLPVPIIQETVAPAPDAKTDVAASTADQLLDRYLRAVGGAETLQKVTTRVEKGVIMVGQTKTPIEVYAKAPNKRVSITRGQSGDSFTAFDGTSGWLGNTGRPGRDMAPADSQNAGLDAEFALALRAKQIFSETLRPLPTEKIGDQDADVLLAKGPITPLTKLYFDRQTGLLLRLERLADVGIGWLPVQVDYADYRVVDGITIPFRWTLARTSGRFTIQVDQVQQNVAVDDAKFAKPGGGR